MTSRVKKSVDVKVKSGQTPLAIVGIGCMFPKADSLGAYWANIRDGVDAITEVPDSHWNPEDYFDADKSAPDMTYGRRGGFLEPVDFDPLLYGMTPNSIEATDTTQLLGLMVTHRALRDAGYSTGKDAKDGKDFDRDRTSVILGVTGTLELVIPLGARLGHPIWKKALKDAGVDEATSTDVVERIAAGYVPWQENSFPGLLGNVAAGRIANRFDLGGTNCVVDAACASSLSAVHMAAMELYAGRSDMAITGGLDSFNDIFMYMCFSKTPALSATGDSRPFEKDGDGTILGEGLGVTVIKRLADAERDGDRIYAVIKGIGTSSDGKGNAVYAPSSAGQKKALIDAYSVAGVEPGSVELVEGHGTGTKVGDAVEASALVDVYGGGEGNDLEKPWCALGSVKSMIGHTKAAAGVAGLIKATMALNSKVLPPTLKVDYPLDVVAPGESPFYVNTVKRPWLGKVEHKRRAALSAFGFGGSNFHCVLEEYDANKSAADFDGRVLILPFGGKTAGGIIKAVKSLDIDGGWAKLRAVAGQLRCDFVAGAKCRLVLVIAKDVTDVAKLIANVLGMLQSQGKENKWSTPDGAFYGRGKADGELAVLFPGQGSQRVGMLRDLACQFPQLLESLGIGNEVLSDEFDGERLSDKIYPQPRFDDKTREADEIALRDTRVAQPALGAVSAGAWGVLQEFGVAAEIFAGHSFGELTALWAGGRFDEAGLVELAKERGRAMTLGEGDRGAMLAVSTNIEEAQRVIVDNCLDVVVANHNGPEQVVLSGATESIEQAEGLFKDIHVRVTRLGVSAAFHSELVADAKGPFGESMKSVKFTAANKLAKVKVYANTTGKEYPTAVSKVKQLLAGQLAKPVLFVEQILNMYKAGARTFLEVGPGGTLTGLVKRILVDKSFTAIMLDGSKGLKNGQYDLALVLGQLASGGYRADLAKWDSGWVNEVGDSLDKKKPGMVIKLTGANYVNDRPEKPASNPKSSSIDEKKKGSQSLNQTSHTPISTASSANHQQVNGEQLSQAIAATQQSIAALQAMQLQTSQLHQQYLQGQETAQQTIQQLVEQQRRLLGGSLDMSVATTPPQAIPQARPMNDTEPLVDSEPVGVYSAAEAKAASNGATQKVLLEVVSQKTGYPVEMLELEMSLDADLGIDSIKRVEILSALQERLPDLPQVQPDDMGALQTLGEIVAYLGDDASTSKPTSVDSSDRSVTIDIGEYQTALLEVVADKTGYPVEMLELEMSLDADLGIDSIKRVEILSALQERLPDAPQVQPDDLGALETLGQIVEYLESNAPEGKVIQASAGVSGSVMIDAGVFETALLEVVAEKTGYPVEMLELEMSLDADLGIDSIKRVEILSALQERLPDAPQVQPDDLGALGTLGEIVAYMNCGSYIEHETTPETVEVDANIEPVTSSDDVIAGVVEKEVFLDRQVLVTKSIDSPATREVFDFPKGSEVWITDDGSVLTKLVCKGFKARGYKPVTVHIEEPVDELPGDQSCGLLILGPTECDGGYIGDIFKVMQGFGGRLREAGEDAFLVSVSRLDGRFGMTGECVNAITGGLAGLVKTANHEWELGNCKAIDVSDDFENLIDLASAIVDEALTLGPVEVGISSEGLSQLVLERVAVDSGPQPLEPGDVIVISGGGRGVTAEVALAMAKAWRATFLLLGRSELPEDEPLWLASLDSEADIRKSLIEQAGKDGDTSPKIINEQVKKLMTGRELLANIAKIEAAGSKVIYRPVDVRDSKAVAKAIDEVRQAGGPICGIVHGAGVLADRLIEDKTAEQFEMVYSTKVDGLSSLLEATAEDDLKVIAIFSSSTGRFGRRGQADYAAANELLNKVAQVESKKRTGCRVVSVNWGPWDGGMVNDSLKKVFAVEGVGVIPLVAGGEYLVDELSGAADGPVEVVLIGSLDGEGVERSSMSSDFNVEVTVDLHLAFERELSVDSMPVLNSHVMNGRAVLPMALIVEWLAHGAMHDNPGMLFHGFDDLRVFKGVIIDSDESLMLQIYSGRGTIHDGFDFVTTELRSGDVLHARTTIVLAADLPDAPAASGLIDGKDYSISDDELYSCGRLFHGEMLEGIESIIGCSEQGIVSQVKSGALPGTWLAKPMRSTWLADPLAIDCSFQLMILWSFEVNGAGSLPTCVRKYRQYQRAFSRGSIQVMAKIQSNRSHAASADIEFVDANEKLVAVMDGYECVIDSSLTEAFARNRLVEVRNA